jgi:hypothetical protein
MRKAARPCCGTTFAATLPSYNTIGFRPHHVGHRFNILSTASLCMALLRITLVTVADPTDYYAELDCVSALMIT